MGVVSRRNSILSLAKNNMWDELYDILKGNSLNLSDINAVCPDNETFAGCSALWFAAANQQWHIVSELLEKNADVNVNPKDLDLKGMSVLWIAANQSQWDIVFKLLEKGADVNRTPEDPELTGMSVLWIAANESQWDIVFKLLEKDADFNIKPSLPDLAEKSVFWLIGTRAPLNTLRAITKKFPKISEHDPWLNKMQDKFFAHISNDSDWELMNAYNLVGYNFTTFPEYLLELAHKLNDINPIVSQAINSIRTPLSLIQKTGSGDINKNFKLIKESLMHAKANEIIAFSSGWRGTYGHFIVAQLHFDTSGNLILTIHNSGTGLELHDKHSEDSNRTASAIAYKISKDSLSSEKIDNLIISLLSTDTPKLNNTELMPDHYYQKILNALSEFHVAKYMEPHESGINYIKGQRSGTCTWKSLMAFVKNTLHNNDLYLLVKYEAKLEALLSYYKEQIDNKRLFEIPVPYLIYSACNNLERLIDKIENTVEYTNNIDIQKRVRFGKDAIKPIKQAVHEYKIPKNIKVALLKQLFESHGKIQRKPTIKVSKPIKPDDFWIKKTDESDHPRM